jgi:hypothetical protein
MGSDDHYRWQRRRLWEHDPHCHWCREVTVLPPQYPGKIAKGAARGNWATIDHLDARHSKERGKHVGEFRRVLACLECNNRRDREATLQMPVQEKWLACGNLYKIAKLSGALNEVSP